ncbi:hypothetical protein CoNPh26_CDS0157 [Staphylococcus phage S-CoN_Ph26]|nr:hypothetical protein CoNPh26_CDS0157 [Staphylococcus phage S-CoN_Ph26]
MFDMLKTLQKYLLKNATVAQYCTGRIRAYHYDETADTSGPYILITPLKLGSTTTINVCK